MSNYNLNILVPKELIEKIKQIAKSNSISLSAQIRLALTDFVKKN